MRPTPKSWPAAGVLALSVLTVTAATASASIRVRKVSPPNPAPAVAPAPVGTGRAAPAPSPARATPAAYWGPAAPAVPKRKPSAVGRFFNRVGKALGSDEAMGTAPAYRDPTTGRTVTGTSKPWMQRVPE